MENLFRILAFLTFCSLSAQKTLPFDSLKLRDAKDFLADDYGNIYLFKNKDFSFTKYDSLGKQKAKLMFALPFKIQSVQNPLNISSFSENAQELKFYDQNLVEIQTYDLRRKFGFVKMVYPENQQQMWLLDESAKLLFRFDFRRSEVIGSYPFDIDFSNIVDMLVFENKLYLLTENHFTVYNLNAEKLFEAMVENAKRLRRENFDVLLIAKSEILKFENNTLKTVFSSANSQIVDKNSSSFFAIKANKLYLYNHKHN